MQGLNDGEDGAAILTAWRPEVEKEQGDRAKAAGEVISKQMEKMRTEYYDAFLPGFGDLYGSKYDKDKAVLEENLTGKNGTPIAGSITRLNMLNAAYSASGQSAEYATAFAEEAKRLGKDQKWVDEFLKDSRSLEAKDFAGNKEAARLSKDFWDSSRKIGKELSDRAFSDGEGQGVGGQLAKGMLIDRHANVMKGSNGVVPEKMRRMLNAYSSMDAMVLAKIAQVSPAEMLTEEGVNRVYDSIVTKKLGDEKQQEAVKRVYAKMKNAKDKKNAVTHADYRYNSTHKLASKEDATTTSPKEDAAASTNTALQSQNTQAGGSSSSSGSPVVLDKTLQELTQVLQGLKGLLQTGGLRSVREGSLLY